MAANRRKQDDKNLETLRELISINGNKYCLDCNQRGPTYVNTTIGSFVCSKCSGMLRGLTPPHRVKSISMATFTPDEIECIKIRGNDYCRRVWLGLYEGESVNFTDEQSVKDFMSDKYEKKRYYIESLPGGSGLCNGAVSAPPSNKSKSKAGSSSINSTPLISITLQSPNANINNTHMTTSRVANNILSPDTTHKVARPVNNFTQPLINNINKVPTPVVMPSVPEFPVDFSKADIYNSSHFNNNNFNNNFVSPPISTPSQNTFNTSSYASNDRYAALADLDMALRQQNLRNMEETTGVNNKNPFQSSNTNDLFSNKNPFFNGGWSASTSVPVNPFMSTMNNESFTNSKNPFL